MWTPDERIRWAFIISSHLKLAHEDLTSDELHDWLARLSDILGMPDSYLEANRERLLKGLPVDESVAH